MIYLMKMQIVAILANFLPVFGLLRHRYECPKLSTSTVDLFLTRLSAIVKKILSNNNFLDDYAEIAQMSPIWPVLPCYGPGNSVQSSQ